MACQLDAELERNRARLAFADALTALEFDELTKIELTAAASAWAKAERAWAVAQFIEARKDGAIEHVS